MLTRSPSDVDNVYCSDSGIVGYVLFLILQELGGNEVLFEGGEFRISTLFKFVGFNFFYIIFIYLIQDFAYFGSTFLPFLNVIDWK